MSNKIHEYARAMYAYMASQAKEVDGRQVYVGKLMEAFHKSGASSGQHTMVRGILVENGCISIESVGNRFSPSVVVLLRPPNDDDFSLTIPGKRDTLTSVSDRVTALESLWRDTLGGLDVRSALLNLEGRISALEEIYRKERG